MKLIMLPLLVSIGYLGFEHKDAMIDLYRAAYPADPAKREALERCAQVVPNFNRLDTGDRDSCYASVFSRAAVGTPPPSAPVSVPNPPYAYNPSHLAGNDIRRQEANDGYHRAQTAAAVSIVPPAHPARRDKPSQ